MHHWSFLVNSFLQINELSVQNHDKELSRNAVYLLQTMDACCALIAVLLRKKLPFDVQDISSIIQSWKDAIIAKSEGYALYHHLPAGALSRAIDTCFRINPYSEILDQPLEIIISHHERYSSKDHKLIAQRLAAAKNDNGNFSLLPGEAWSEVAIEDINSSRIANTWYSLLEHSASANSARPSRNWRKKSIDLVDSMGTAAFVANIQRWFPLVDKPRTRPIEDWPQWQPDPNKLILDRHADVLKGLAWCCGLTGLKDVVAPLSGLAFSAYRKVPGVGPRNTRLGNACIWALGQIADDSSIAELALLSVKVKFKPAQKAITAATKNIAAQMGIKPEDIEEAAIPDFGFTGSGKRNEQFGDYVVAMELKTNGILLFQWSNKNGKSLKSTPTAVRRQYPEQLAQLKQSGKDSQKILMRVRERLDFTFKEKKTWQYSIWKKCYIDHPIQSIAGRTLIWLFEFEDGFHSGIYIDGKIVDSNGFALKSLKRSLSVRLWHPLNSTVSEVRQWRKLIESRHLVQPFKQAHREIYILTDAETETGTYSNRFASHIVRQHQFNTLCAVRGWNSKLRMCVDDSYPPPHMLLPDHDIRAEFWVNSHGAEFGVDTNEAGAYLFLATDQVRFYPANAAENLIHATGHQYYQAAPVNTRVAPLALSNVPAMVLSETLRDIDLFIGVTSVGNDPTWNDGGPGGRFREYWNTYSFGELLETAKTRIAILKNLVPKLKIRDRCSFEKNFLVVKGNLRTYKIHLGSSNILMEPDDQYLCIVPSNMKSRYLENYFLPFEDDARLSLILSKAFLLAQDDEITDKTIVSQITSR